MASEQQLELPGIVLESGLELPAGLSFDEWEAIGISLKRVGRSHLWWIGDWLRYGEANYGELYAQAVNETDLAYGVLRNAKYVAGRFDLSCRHDNLPWSFHSEVAGLEPEIAHELLKVAETCNWTQRDLRAAVARYKLAEKHAAIAEAARGSNIAGQFCLLYADPPWSFQTYSELGKAISPEQHYPTMPFEEIAQLEIDGRKVDQLAYKDAALFMWCTSSNLELALPILRCWGFTYRTHLVWDKERTGTGYIFLNQHELLLYAKRGAFPMPEYKPPSVLRSRRTDHSAKPLEMREVLESMYPQLGPDNRLELFARGEVPGWSTWGNQA